MAYEVREMLYDYENTMTHDDDWEIVWHELGQRVHEAITQGPDIWANITISADGETQMPMYVLATTDE